MKILWLAAAAAVGGVPLGVAHASAEADPLAGPDLRLTLETEELSVHDRGVSLAAMQDYDDDFDDVNGWGPEAGDWEFTLSGTGVSDEDLDNNFLGASVSIGYFLSDDWSISLRQSVSFADTEAGGSSLAGSTRGALDYHFDLDRLRPFIGVNFGGIYGEDTNESFIAGAEGGLKWYAKPDTFIYGLVEWQFIFDDADDVDENFDDGQWVYTIGVGFNF